MIQHEIFKEKVMTAVARAGLPMSPAFDPSFTPGVHLEMVDEEELPPRVFLQWRVNPVLRTHFMNVPREQLLDDKRVREMNVIVAAMNYAIIEILKVGGFQASVETGERIGEIIVSEFTEDGMD